MGGSILILVLISSRTSRPERIGATRVQSPFALAAYIAVLLLAGSFLAGSASAEPRAVSCLGRLEPGDGVIRLASPSGGGVIGELSVGEGDSVEQGQLVATLVTRTLHLAEVSRLQAELDQAKREANRLEKLSRGNAASSAQYDAALIDVRIAEAGLAAARAQVALSELRSPVAGEVLEIHARVGELIGPEGVLEIGETDRMMAVAEVYETDIGLVNVGQTVKMTSPALAEPLTGRVDRIGHKIGRMDVIGADPIAKTDARVIEVRIELDDIEKARALTHLQLEVEIAP